MGMFRLGSSCKSCKNDNTNLGPLNELKYPNPDPMNFSILNVVENLPWVVARIKYHNCTNYEGEKILVYRGVTKTQILWSNILDPHFCDNGCLSPVARFEPTSYGWELAMKMIGREV
jgi:hypothetical protein